MNEILSISENREKVLPGQTLLLAEPIFKHPEKDESAMYKFKVPLGQEGWVENLAAANLGEAAIVENLANEYLAIAAALKDIGVPFRIIVAHRKQMNEAVTPVVLERGAGSIPYAINLEQFADGTVLCTGDDYGLKVSLGEIVGPDKVSVTSKPIIFYPIFRNGGIRCMLLFAPQKLVG